MTENPPENGTTLEELMGQVVDINGERALNMKNAALYLGMSYANLQNVLNKNRHIHRWKPAYGGRDSYLLLKDLDSLKGWRRVEHDEE